MALLEILYRIQIFWSEGKFQCRVNMHKGYFQLFQKTKKLYKIYLYKQFSLALVSMD